MMKTATPKVNDALSLRSVADFCFFVFVMDVFGQYFLCFGALFLGKSKQKKATKKKHHQKQCDFQGNCLIKIHSLTAVVVL